MKRSPVVAVASLTLLALPLALVPVGPGAQSPEFKLRFGGSDPGRGLLDKTTVEFVELSEKKSSGRITWDYFCCDQLGGDIAQIEQMMANSIQAHGDGLAHVNVVGSMIFAGMSGTAQADAAGLGQIEIEEMRRDGFDPAYAAAVSATSAVIGPIIPPSVILVIFAVMTEISVARLFLGGFIPGVLLSLSLMVLIYWQAVTGRVVAPRQPCQPFSEV